MASKARSRWAGLVAGMWMQTCGGISYAFSLYSADLKLTLGYNQELIDGLGTAKDIGGNVGIISGLLIDRTSAQFVLLIGALMHWSFYMMLYLAATKQIRPSYWQMCGIIMLGTNGATWFNTAVLVTCMRNFPSDRGVVVGLLKGFIGLSGAIFTQVYTAIYAPFTGPFLLFCAVFPPLMALFSMLVIQPVDPPKVKGEGDSRKFASLYIMGLVLAFYLMFIIIVQDFFVTTRAVSQVFMSVMVLILFVPGLLVLRKTSALDHTAAAATAAATDRARSPKASKLHTRNSFVIDVGQKPFEFRKDSLPSSPSKFKLRLGNDHTLLQALRTQDYWLLFFAMGCGTGSGLTAINNLAQMAESLNSKSIGAFVALVSVWNFLGRLGFGYISEWYMKKNGTPRPLFLFFVQALMGVAHLLFASSIPSLLYSASILVGLAHGAHWTLMVATSSELFGLRHFGALYNTLSISSTIGSYLLSVKLAGYLYDRQVASKGEKCRGPHCFRHTFLVMACICVVGSLSLLRLKSRTKLVYREIQKVKLGTPPPAPSSSQQSISSDSDGHLS